MPRHKKFRVSILGPPGSGKGTIGHLLEEAWGIHRVSAGDIIRDDVRSKTAFGKRAKAAMDAGELIPDELVVGLVCKLLKKPLFAKGVLYDGFPRTRAQAEMLEKRRINPKVVIYLDVQDKILVDRLSSRRVCLQCHAVYNLKTSPPKNLGVCDHDQTALVQRGDDKPEVIQRRLEIHRSKVKDLIGFYKDRGLLLRVDAKGPPKKIVRQVLRLMPRDTQINSTSSAFLNLFFPPPA